MTSVYFVCTFSSTRPFPQTSIPTSSLHRSAVVEEIAAMLLCILFKVHIAIEQQFLSYTWFDFQFLYFSFSRFNFIRHTNHSHVTLNDYETNNKMKHATLFCFSLTLCFCFFTFLFCDDDNDLYLFYKRTRGSLFRYFLSSSHFHIALWFSTQKRAPWKCRGSIRF